jgi:transposase
MSNRFVKSREYSMEKKSTRRDLEALEARRREGMRLLGKGLSQAEVARRVGVCRQTAANWAAARDTGAKAWKNKPLGRPAALDDAHRRRLAKILLKGPQASGFATELWTLSRIAQVIHCEFGVQYSIVNVWHILRAMNFSCQRPVMQATERNEQAIAQWKTKRWPALKKKPAEREERSSS